MKVGAQEFAAKTGYSSTLSRTHPRTGRQIGRESSRSSGGYTGLFVSGVSDWIEVGGGRDSNVTIQRATKTHLKVADILQFVSFPTALSVFLLEEVSAF
jgi:hypothetical protein